MRASAVHSTTVGTHERGITVDALLDTKRRRFPRRTLGLCAFCHRPVEFGQEHVRIERRAWHLDCALSRSRPITA